jgi:excisionase family DNA binding protein
MCYTYIVKDVTSLFSFRSKLHLIRCNKIDQHHRTVEDKSMTEPVSEGWVTTEAAGSLTGYAAAYLRRLASQGRIEARKVGRDWLINQESLLAYKAQMDALGDQRHNPWREDLAALGMGRQRRGGDE